MGGRSRRGGGRALFHALACAPLLAGCARPLTAEPPPATGSACDELAYIFAFVAAKKDEGLGKEPLLEALRRGTETPFAAHPERSYRQLAQVVELVYRRPELDAGEIEASVRAHCVVGDDGQPVLRALWPRPAQGS
jgi:hypothetical protein